MEFLFFIILISFTAGFLWGRYTTKVAFTRVFKRFSNEMHKQYLACLKAKGIKIKSEFNMDLPVENTNHDKTSVAS